MQEVGALLVLGAAAVERMDVAMAAKPGPLKTLPVARGEAWAVIFAAALKDEAGDGDRMLPRIDGALPLYEAAPGWWLPVGAIVEAPEHVRPALNQAVCDHYGFEPPAVVVPRWCDDADLSKQADIYLVHRPAPFCGSKPVGGPEPTWSAQ